MKPYLWYFAKIVVSGFLLLLAVEHLGWWIIPLWLSAIITATNKAPTPPHNFDGRP